MQTPLYVREQDGSYKVAGQEVILAKANQIIVKKFKRGTKISDSKTATLTIKGLLAGYDHEVFAIMFLDSRNRVIEWREITHGTIDCANVSLRVVAQAALQLNAAAIILAHNHPSGDSTPSAKDSFLTKALKDGLKVFDIIVVDHIVVGEDTTSMRDLDMF